SVTSLVPQRFRFDASRAVRMPSSVLLLFRLAPLKAKPDRNRGFSILALARVARVSFAAGFPTAGDLPPDDVSSAVSWRKNPWVAICRMLGASILLSALLVARAPVRRWASGKSD